MEFHFSGEESDYVDTMASEIEHCKNQVSGLTLLLEKNANQTLQTYNSNVSTSICGKDNNTEDPMPRENEQSNNQDKLQWWFISVLTILIVVFMLASFYREKLKCF